MCVNEEIQQVKSEIKQLEAQQLELSKRKRKGIATEDELAELDHLSSVLSRRESDLHDLRKIQAPHVQVKENPPELVAFHNACKNIPHQLEGGTVIKLPDGVFILGNNSIGSSIYVRQCYPELLNLSLNIIAQLESHHLIILGNPGIGKTFFGYFMLIHLLQQGETVVYESGKANRRFLFSPTLTAKGKRDDFADILDEQSTFYLADAVKPVDVLAKTVLLTSPQRDIWYSFLKDKCTLRYMPVWIIEEIQQCRAMLFPKVSEEKANGLFKKWGGIPRFVLESAHDLSFQDELDEVLKGPNVESVFDCVNMTQSGENISHRLVHFEVINYRKNSYQFASDYVREKVTEKLLETNTHGLLKFLAATRHHPKCAILRGHLFEGYAHMILSQGGTFPIRALQPDHDAEDSPTSLTLNKRSTLIFDNDLNISNQRDDFYFQPKSQTFSSVDSFIRPNYLFQITTSLKHPCKEDGLMDVLKSLGKPADPKLFFVVPSDCFEDFKYQNYKDSLKRTPKSLSEMVQAIQQYKLSIDVTVK